MNALGATIIRTPTSAAFDAADSHISEAQRIKERLNAVNPGSAHILDQYTNPYNPIAHYDTTAEEIISQLNGKELHLFVATAGTGQETYKIIDERNFNLFFKFNIRWNNLWNRS